MKIIYANIAWFCLLIVGITVANLSRFSSDGWEDMADARLKFTLLYGGITLLLMSSIAGLHLRRKWGYELALASNSIMALLPISLFLATFILLPESSITELVSMHALNIAVSMVSLVFWVYQVCSGIKVKYVP